MADFFQTQNPIKPEQIMDVVIRRRWIILIPLCIALTIGLYFTLTTSKTYQASTLILVQPQRIPNSYVRSVVTTTISQRISTIAQQILSTSNLEKIIDQFGLFEDSPGMYLEDKIASMRRRIKVKTEQSRHGAEAFSIVFTGSDRQQVMRVANTLATYFMDENLKVREAQAVGTSEFLETELEKHRKMLAEYEKNISEYRARYLGGLPDELDSNLRTLDRLQEQLSSKQNLLRELRGSANLLGTQIVQSKEMSMDDQYGLFAFDEDLTGESNTEKKLAVALRALDELSLKYTEKHPDVLKLVNIVDKLNKAVEEEKIQLENITETLESAQSDNEKTAFPDIANFGVMQQELQLKHLRDEIQKVQSDIRRIESRMDMYQQRVEDTPKREQELKALQRDYTNIKAIFSSLLDRKLEAELSVNMEKKQKGEQFRILDHARLPEKPISPNVKMLFLISVAAALGISGVLIFFLEFINQPIRHDEQIEKELGLTILARIPPLEKTVDKIKKRFEAVLFIGFSLYAAAFLTFFTVLNMKGLDRTIDYIRQHIQFLL